MDAKEVEDLLKALKYTQATPEFIETLQSGNIHWSKEVPLGWAVKGMPAYKLLQEINLCTKNEYYDGYQLSGTEARKLIRSKIVRINGHLIEDEMQIIDINYTITDIRLFKKPYPRFVVERGNRLKNTRGWTHRIVQFVIRDQDIIKREDTPWGELLTFDWGELLPLTLIG
jgi:hypothetical protein